MPVSSLSVGSSPYQWGRMWHDTTTKDDHMNAYFVAQISITDPEGYEVYLEGFDDVFSKFGGRVLAVDDNPTVLEGAWHYSRIVLIQFPDERELRRWYDSPDYQQLIRLRQKASRADILMIAGRP